MGIDGASVGSEIPAEIVQAVNKASERKGAIAARKLPSGDVIITFQDAGTRDWHAKSGGWIGAAFGETAKEAKRTLCSVGKGDVEERFEGRDRGCVWQGIGADFGGKSEVPDPDD